MQTSLEETSSLERRLTVTVPPDRMNSELDKCIQKIARDTPIKGFRPGKVTPAHIAHVKKTYGDAARQEALTHVIQETLQQVLQEKDITPATTPRVEVISLEDNKPLEFKAVFEVLPIEPIRFTSVTVSKKIARVEEPDIDRVLTDLRKQHATWHESDAPAEEGDQLFIDFTGYMDGQAFKGGEGKNIPLLLGSRTMIPGFEAGLIGACKGDTVDLNVQFPEAYRVTELAGKDALFVTHIRKVSKATLPDLDEAFVKKFRIKSGKIEDLRAELKQNLDRELKEAIKNDVKQQVLGALIQQNTWELPTSLIEQEAKRIEAARGAPIIGNAPIPENVWNSAKRNVLLGALTAACVKQEKISLDKKRVDAFIDTISKAYENFEKTRQWYYANAEQMANIEYHVIQEQMVETLLEKATVFEKPCSFQKVMSPI